MFKILLHGVGNRSGKGYVVKRVKISRAVNLGYILRTLCLHDIVKLIITLRAPKIVFCNKVAVFEFLKFRWFDASNAVCGVCAEFDKNAYTWNALFVVPALRVEIKKGFSQIHNRSTPCGVDIYHYLAVHF